MTALRIARLEEFSTTARDEFDRMLSGGPSVLNHLPEQHSPSVVQRLGQLGLQTSQAMAEVCELSLRLEHGMMRPGVEWHPSEADNLKPMHCACLRLYKLLQWIDENAPLSKTIPHAGQFIVHAEVLRLWWRALVVPELHAEGVSLQQSRNRSKQGQAGQERAREMLRRGLHRCEVRNRLMEEFGISPQMANRHINNARKLKP